MELLPTLQLEKNNAGASTGIHWWSKTKTAGKITSYNPSTGKPIASIYQANLKDVNRVIKEAHQAYLAWRQVPAPKRGDIIRCIGNELRHYKDYLGSLISLEMGKSKQEGNGEVQEMIDMADFAVGQSRMLYGITLPSERPQHRLFEQWHPLGVVAVMTAFNFPMAVWSWNAFLAAITGNTVVWKPSPKASLSALAIQHICNRILEKFGYRGIFSVIISDQIPIIHDLLDDPRIPLISFTGSSAIGREVGARVARRFGKTILELSGNNAIIVDKTADLALAAQAVVFGAIGTAGQRCTTTRRVFIHEAIYHCFVGLLKKSYADIKVGDPLGQKNLMGPLIDQSAVDQFTRAIQSIHKMKGRILCGGHIIKRPGYFVEPTLVEAQNHWGIVQEETFAPILYLIKINSVEEGITLQNESAHGLSSAIFTGQVDQAELFLSSEGSDCGIANVNVGTSGAEIGAAFGGEKATGGGREAGSDAWKAYMRRQTCTINGGKVAHLAQGIHFKTQ